MQNHILLNPSDCTGVTVSGTTGTALPTPDEDVTAGIIKVEQQAVRCKWDGDAPLQTGVDGARLIAANEEWTVYGRNLLTALKFVPVGSTASYVQVCYMKGE
jgi:capsular polysaccharide biosynthesis protein